MKTITAVLLLIVCAAQAQTVTPTYTREPVTQMVPHCAVGYQLEQYTPAESFAIPAGEAMPAVSAIYPAQRPTPDHWDVVDPASIPELHDQTKYRCSPVNGASVTAPNDVPIYAGTISYSDSGTVLTQVRQIVIGPVTVEISTGKVTIDPKYAKDMDDASKQFWDAVEKYAGLQHDSEAACSASLKAANERTLKCSKIATQALVILGQCQAITDAARKIAEDAEKRLESKP